MLYDITKGWGNDIKGNLIAYILVVAVFTSDVGFQYDIASSIMIALLWSLNFCNF